MMVNNNIFGKFFFTFFLLVFLSFFLVGCSTIPFPEDNVSIGDNLSPILDDPNLDDPNLDNDSSVVDVPVVVGVFASSHDGNVPLNLIDGVIESESRWSALGVGEWVQFNFSSPITLKWMRIAAYVGDTRTSDFSIHTSLDGVSFEEVYYGSTSGSTLDFENYSLTHSSAKFVRLVGYGNNISGWNSYTEVDLQGHEVDIDFDNVVLDPPVTIEPPVTPPVVVDPPANDVLPVDLIGTKYDMNKYCTPKNFISPKFTLKLKSASDYDNIVYIDPSFKGTGDGSSTSSPLKSWSDVSFKANTAYLQKRGTSDVISKRFTLQKIDNVLIGAYGSGEKPYLKTTSSISGDNSLFLVSGSDGFTIRDIKLSSPGLASVVRLGSHLSTRSTNAMVYNLTIVDTRFNGIRCFGVDRIKILHTHIENIPDDGIICQGVNFIEVAYNHIVKINTNWKPPMTPQSDAGGDSLQFSRVTNWHVHNNILDRSDTGNKFAFISNTDGHHGLAECNVMMGPIRTSEGGAVIYIGGGQNDIVIRYNRLLGPSLGALYSHSHVSFHDNILKGDGVSSIKCDGCNLKDNIILS